MDQFLTPEFWKSQLAVVTTAPWLILPWLVAVGWVVWWLRGKIDKGQIERLREQLEALKTHLEVRAERLIYAQEKVVYAQEKERDVKAQLVVAQTRVAAAQESVALYAKENPKLVNVQSSIELSVAAMEQANVISDLLSKVLFEPLPVSPLPVSKQQILYWHSPEETIKSEEFRRYLNKLFSESPQVTKRSDD